MLKLVQHDEFLGVAVVSEYLVTESNYVTAINSLCGRLSAADQSLAEIEQAPNLTEHWKNLDFIALQVRKSCELILLGSVLAHLDGGETGIDARKWRPKDAFLELTRVNKNSMPTPIHYYWSVSADKSKQIIPISKPLPFEILSRIYGQCGDLLHVPSAAKVLNETVSPFYAEKFRGWVNGLIKISFAHALMLPDIKRVIVYRRHSMVFEPETFIIESDGPAIFITDTLSDFDLLKL